MGQTTGGVGPCFLCGATCHYTNKCPQKRPDQTPTQGATPTQNRNGNSASTPARQNQARARVNHVALEEAQEAPDVVLGMFPVNDCQTTVLFDSGASHSFISATYVQTHNIPMAMLKNKMIISAPGGDMHARHVCP